ncbi:lipid A deacylase LpxR family protein [Tenacibaculum amylolyticum]|uniref:lipid A deacylase LpxR family protein n=1 Tax=Tenacibaculum amylolyticum TaxID=104269 RepID=UPI003892CFAB
MKKSFLLTLLFINALNCISQVKYSSSFNIINDNDLYISTSQDRYYTNGVFLSYNYMSKKASEDQLKKIYSIQLGQRMYSPFKANVRDIREHDRPFAAYLYAGFGFRNFYKNNTYFGLSGEIGVIGPSAFGEESMEFVHNIYGFAPATGWKYQIKDAFALNFKAEYLKELTASSNKYFDLNWKNEATLGTVFTDVSTGFHGRIGIKPLQKAANSVAFNSNLNNDATETNNEKELFFYINPMLRYTLYDATIEGSFLNDNSIITYDVRPLVLTTEVGFWFTTNRFNFKYMIVHHTKKLESENVSRHNFYGGIQINYLFN